eukprot:gnl/Hemi2/6611_TR2254_c0_g2_i1.p1 gnl/Hemi2/6611_TR2254_c0_g2~~gnl/Hemi2/6611_TR2254_c0_g2_i1.p1  ORF type:complete len:516 (-),score=197.60 gnl/Hemi2/6611_TR2254_c0_g2_i1:113-1618(-)
MKAWVVLLLAVALFACVDSLSLGKKKKKDAVLATTVQPGQNALVVVDYQKCFVEGGSLPVLGGSDLKKKIAALMVRKADGYPLNNFGLIVQTRDYHPPGHVSYLSTHFPLLAKQYGAQGGQPGAQSPGTGAAFSDYVSGWVKDFFLPPVDPNPQLSEEPPAIDPSTCLPVGNPPKPSKQFLKAVSVTFGPINKLQFLWPDHCSMNSEDSELLVDPHPNDIVLLKGVERNIDSYSGVKDDAGTVSPLPALLKAMPDLENIFVAGLAMDFCVKNTALDLHTLFPNKNIFIIKEASASVSPLAPSIMECEFKKTPGIGFITIADMIAMKVLDKDFAPTSQFMDKAKEETPQHLPVAPTTCTSEEECKAAIRAAESMSEDSDAATLLKTDTLTALRAKLATFEAAPLPVVQQEEVQVQQNAASLSAEDLCAAELKKAVLEDHDEEAVKAAVEKFTTLCKTPTCASMIKFSDAIADIAKALPNYANLSMLRNKHGALKQFAGNLSA